mmetsp:Transcript_28833/g.85118  ORF Transcript_28833/g.85118 Transcript_28833/m.85118 type:complete len:213 (+) Transcript_28833:375-1013(+)
MRRRTASILDRRRGGSRRRRRSPSFVVVVVRAPSPLRSPERRDRGARRSRKDHVGRRTSQVHHDGRRIGGGGFGRRRRGGRLRRGRGRGGGRPRSTHGFRRARKGTGHHHHVQGDPSRLFLPQDGGTDRRERRRYSRPRRFRRRGRSDTVHGRRRRIGRGRGRGTEIPDQVRAGTGAVARFASHRGIEQGRSVGREGEDRERRDGIGIVGSV